MALFGSLHVIKQQVKEQKFDMAFSYLEKVLTPNSTENSRLLNLAINAFEKVDLNEENFALEQIYNSKERNECFFESHRQYIDVQFILEGEEIIEVCNIDDMIIDMSYNKDMDLLKYQTTDKVSIIRLTKGDVAIFYPEDVHMPCIASNGNQKVIKTVVKVKV